jgi:hypothetical protein
MIGLPGSVIDFRFLWQSAELAVAFPPREPDGEPMIESIAVQYRAQATRYHALAEQADCPARESLYRRLERGYLTLADLARLPSGHYVRGVRRHPHENPTASSHIGAIHQTGDANVCDRNQNGRAENQGKHSLGHR